MRTDRFAGLDEGIWERARAAPARLLAVDYDGTLAPCATAPETAPPLSETRRAIERIARDGLTSVAILSGQAPGEVVRRLGELPVPIVGDLGLTTRFPDGGMLQRPLDPDLVEALDRAGADLERTVAPARVERRRSSIVIHTRALAPVLAGSAQRRIRSVLALRHADPRLELRPVEEGLELRARGFDKGVALVELLNPLGPDAFPVVLGNDGSDDDAFRAATARGGVGIRVCNRSEESPQAHLVSPAEIAAFLSAWSERVDREPVGSRP